MKKILIFALALIALSGCNKKTKESDAERAYLAIYLPAVEQSALLRGMVYHAQRLNLLMNQTDDWSDLNNVPSPDGEVNYKESFFGSAQITNDNGRVTIDFGNNYINVKGCVIIDTHNALLSADGTTWELVEVTSDEDKFQEMNMDIAWKFDSWESFEITNSAGSLDCQARGVVIATGAAQSNWNLDFTITPGSGTMTDIQKWSEGKHSVKAGSRGWGIPLGRTMQFNHEVDLDMVYNNQPFQLSQGRETVSSPEFAATDPVKYPASEVSVVYSSNGATIIYNNLQETLY